MLVVVDIGITLDANVGRLAKYGLPKRDYVDFYISPRTIVSDWLNSPRYPTKVGAYLRLPQAPQRGLQGSLGSDPRDLTVEEPLRCNRESCSAGQLIIDSSVDAIAQGAKVGTAATLKRISTLCGNGVLPNRPGVEKLQRVWDFASCYEGRAATHQARWQGPGWRRLAA